MGRRRKPNHCCAGLILALCLTLLVISCGKVTAPADVEPPATPANFMLIGGGDGQAHFRWVRNLELDFDKYLVYRAVDSPESFVKLSETQQNEFVDRFLDYDRVYYYYITAIDFAGNESLPTAVIDIQPANISSPPSPTNMIVSGHNYSNLNLVEFAISWAAPNVSDVWKYQVYRGSDKSFAADATTLLNSTTLSTFYDRSVQPGDSFYYRVVSVDLGLKASIPSGAVGDRILQRLNPISPSNRIEFAAPFQFTWAPLEHAVAYQVFVARAPLSDIIWNSPKLKDTKIDYAGTTLVPGSIYYWWVGAYSKEEYVTDEGALVQPDINSRSEIWTFFVR